MLLGGTIAGPYTCPEEWEELLVKSHFKAVAAPFNCHTPREEIAAYVEAAQRRSVVIAEAGVWKNPMDPDPEKAAAAIAYAKGQLAMADEWGIPCCVNIVGTASSVAWDAADKSNFTEETYRKIIEITRDIIDSVQPKRAFYCIEPMPWMVPDSPEAYLQLIKDVDRPQFAAHMDFVNMINCPRRFLDAEGFVEDCYRLLTPYLKSSHLKDSHMPLNKLTATLTECSPGEGDLDFVNILKIMDRYLPADAPVLLEHMQTFDEYARAYDYVAAQAEKAGVSL
ncbi:MAG: sugar phosphate isomerase/epimerase [Lachnospiraceae bacterium]|nr:sugar phosphate isomerase/epimerase [Lachnospiraceae bacterium]